MIAKDLVEAKRYVEKYPPTDYVIKANGPAGGKGVILPKTYQHAQQVIRQMMTGRLFGEAGKKIVFQERLTGPEVSMFAVFDGEKAVVLPLAQDHKRLFDNDEGPNTGGMGEPIHQCQRAL